MGQKTIPELDATTSITDTGLVPVDSGVQSYKMTILNFATSIRNYLKSMRQWSATVTYAAGDLIRNADGIMFRSGFASNLNWDPDVAIDEWEGGHEYSIGEFVRGLGVSTVYECIQAGNEDIDPSEPSYWDEIGTPWIELAGEVDTSSYLELVAHKLKLKTSIALSSLAVSSSLSYGGLNVAKLQTGSRILRGACDNNGGILLGSGFSVVRNTTGVNTITFTTAFSATPVIVVTLNGGDEVVSVSAASTTGFQLDVADAAGGSHQDRAYSFIAIG